VARTRPRRGTRRPDDHGSGRAPWFPAAPLALLSALELSEARTPAGPCACRSRSGLLPVDSTARLEDMQAVRDRLDAGGVPSAALVPRDGARWARAGDRWVEV